MSDRAALVFREIAPGTPEYEEGERLRRRVLRDPLGIVPSDAERAEWLTMRHLAVFEGERMIGYLMLADEGNGSVRMRQVAVDFDRQRHGVGRALVARSEELARASGYRTMTLHARDTAVPFYLALGYEVFGDPFVEVTIPHRKMRKTLDGGAGAPPSNESARKTLDGGAGAPPSNESERKALHGESR